LASITYGFNISVKGAGFDIVEDHLTTEFSKIKELISSWKNTLYISYMYAHIKIEGITSNVVNLKWDIKDPLP
jgi:syndetin